MLLEEHKLNIFDQHCKPLQELSGRYHGLAEGTDGDIFTLRGLEVLRFIKLEGMYVLKEKIKLEVIEAFEKWHVLSRPKNLLYCMHTSSLHITDHGLHKLLTVNMRNSHHKVAGYLGEGIGQFKRPTGMVVDSMGNLLVLDQGNNRIVVYTSSGKWVKVLIEAEEFEMDNPCGIHFYGDNVVVVFKGKGGRGGMVRYKLEN